MSIRCSREVIAYFSAPISVKSCACFGWLFHKAVVAGPAGRRAPDHFFGQVCFLRVPFLGSAHFTFYSDLINLPKFIDAIINNTRVSSIYRTSQGVKALENYNDT